MTSSTLQSNQAQKKNHNTKNKTKTKTITSTVILTSLIIIYQQHQDIETKFTVTSELYRSEQRACGLGEWEEAFG